jgi:acyl carrier protein
MPGAGRDPRAARLRARDEDPQAMTQNRDLLEMFKTVAARVDKREFPKVSRQSVITELGIDSLSMMQIVGEMETELGILIPDEDLVELVTVGDLVSKVEQRLGNP